MSSQYQLSSSRHSEHNPAKNAEKHMWKQEMSQAVYIF